MDISTTLPNPTPPGSKPSIMNLGHETVQTLVGEDRKPFVLHKNVIRQFSAYFFRAFGPDFQEGEDESMHLPGVTKSTFVIFQNWLYMQLSRSTISTICKVNERLYTEEAEQSNHDDSGVGGEAWSPWLPSISWGDYDDSYTDLQPAGGPGEEHREDESMRDTGDARPQEEPANETTEEYRVRDQVHNGTMFSLLQLFIFADAYDTTTLRNDILSACQTLELRAMLWPGFALVPHAFERLPASSTFCQYLIKSTALNWGGEEPQTEAEKATMALLPSEFLLPVMRINARRAFVGEQVARELENELKEHCAFHEHSSKEEKEACQAHAEDDKPFIQSLIAMCMDSAQKMLDDTMHDASG